MGRAFRYILLYGFLFLGILGVFSLFNNPNPKMEPIRYDEFVEAVEQKQITSAELKPVQLVYEVKGTLKGAEEGQEFITNIPMDDEALMTQIRELGKDKKVEIEFEKAPERSLWVSFLTGMLPLIIILVLFFFLLNQVRGGGGGGGRMMDFGKSKAKLQTDDRKKVTFQDVAGADEEKQELMEVVDFLKDSRKFVKLGARIPKGILLVGPPGTGKTLLARAVAGEAGVPFFTISGSDFVEMFVGVGASRVRDLFEQAKKNSPCIIFIDEIDAVGRKRGAGLGGGHDEREQTLNQLLVEMDGFEGNEGIIVVAATNRADILDPALLRPGRFDRQILVNNPDVRGREDILKVHARNKPLDESVKLNVVAKQTPGFSGAQLENLLNEAALVAARRGKDKIDMADIDEGTDRVIAGPAKPNAIVSEKVRRRVAIHEAGHVVVGLMLDDASFVHKVTIVPRGKAGGYAISIPRDESSLSTTQELLDRIAGTLGGRAAEELVLGDVSTGALQDFQQATDIARRMVTEFGMSERLGPIRLSSERNQMFFGRDMGSAPSYSEETARIIDEEVQTMLKDEYRRTFELLEENKALLELIAENLLEEETLDAEQINHLKDHGTLPERLYDQRDREETEEQSTEPSIKDDSSEETLVETDTKEEKPQSPVEKEDNSSTSMKRDESEK